MSKCILFQGDSITDVNRMADGGDGLGQGYVKLISDYFREKNKDACVLNRGISGNRTGDLVKRWERDCIAYNPDVLTILIGINDCWRKYDNNEETSVEEFEENYDEILSRSSLETQARIILMEPFVLPIPEDRKEWRVTLDPYIQIVRKLAKKYQTELITLDGIFAKAAIKKAYTELASDGVHPTPEGHQLIAKEWIRTYEL